MFKWKLIMFLFGLKTATCDCHSEKKLGFANGRSFSKITHVAKLPLELPESSGLIYSKKDGMLISNNDSGNKSELISFRPNGDLVNIQSFETLKNIDWEDLTQDDQGNIYIGDFGNNRQMRKDLKIYKIGQSAVDTINFRYADQLNFPPDQLNFDCEAIFWYQNRLYLFTKSWEKEQKVTKIYTLSDNQGNYTLLPMAELPLKTQVTAADISPDGQHFVLLTYGKALFFDIKNNIIDFSSPSFCRKTRRKQTEAIAYKNNQELYFSNEQGNLYLLKIRSR
jgi:hypothetical protein